LERNLNIIITSLKMALQEFRSNKLRTFLSLLGITFGIFCIISVLATVSSMKTVVQNDISAMGSNSIMIDKWQYINSGDFPWWRYYKRPSPKYEELKKLKDRVSILENASYLTRTQAVFEYQNDLLQGAQYYGVTEDFSKIEHFNIRFGRYLQQTDLDQGENVVVIGYSVAEKIFVNPEFAIGKTVRLQAGKPAVVIGVIEKQGESMFDFWHYDDCIIMPYKFLKQMVRDEDADPVIIAEARKNVSIPAVKDELTGAMRSIHKLSPNQEDDYSLNDIETLTKSTDVIFKNMNIGGWAIAALSLIVGMFGVANIMFVTVRERTTQIGLKKALGAKKSIIVSEFLLESSFLCIIGGLIGVIAVFLLAAIVTAVFHFPISVPINIIGLAIGICLFVGVVAGIIPAVIASRLDPVVAIRSTN
jgi:putative ABC transport system permease protein